jgi:hypothetical protein
MSVEEEVKQMIDVMTDNKPPEEVKDGVQEEVKEEEKVAEVKEEVKEPTVKEEVKVEPKVEEKKEEPPIDEKDKAIADLRAEIELLRAGQVDKGNKEEESKPPTFEPQDFIAGMDLDDLTREPSKFNEVLNNVYKKARLDAGESLLKDIPAIVKNQVEVQQTLFTMANEFYGANKDLVPYKKNVALIFEKAISDNPDKPYSELMEQVATETRTKLGIKPAVEKEEVKKDPPPKLPTKGSSSGRSVDKPSVKPLQDELEAMNKAIGR